MTNRHDCIGGDLRGEHTVYIDHLWQARPAWDVDACGRPWDDCLRCGAVSRVVRGERIVVTVSRAVAAAEAVRS